MLGTMPAAEVQEMLVEEYGEGIGFGAAAARVQALCRGMRARAHTGKMRGMIEGWVTGVCAMQARCRGAQVRGALEQQAEQEEAQKKAQPEEQGRSSCWQGPWRGRRLARRRARRG